jgi:hypothetical protein
MAEKPHKAKRRESDSADAPVFHSDPVTELRIRYAQGQPAALTVRLIHSWNRGEITAAEIMSTSSGPKDYLKTQVYEIFDAKPEIDRVVMVRGNGPTFFLLHINGAWFDITGEQIIQDAKPK